MSAQFLMKARQLDVNRLQKGVTTWSIKMDGMRAFWDGGISRGRIDVPWCRNTMATGLWTINANPIYPPQWWLDRLPRGVFMDGELWMGVQRFRDVIRAARAKSMTDEREALWQDITFQPFEFLKPVTVYTPRDINQPTCKVSINFEVFRWALARCREEDIPWYETQPSESFCLIEEHPFTSLDDIPFNDLVAQGHEGVMFRNPIPWQPTRSWALMKWKPFLDSEGRVIGATGGDGKHLGRIGALIVKWRNPKGEIVIFELSGLTDAERESNDSEVCKAHVKKPLPIEVQSLEIPYGSPVTFKYRELTDDGKPREARYWRKHG